LEVADTICELAGASRSLVRVDPPTAGAPPGFEPLDVSRAVATLGYAPRALADGLRTMMGGSD
jgi:nucleoside-diphosphate-sugar epimerase